MISLGTPLKRENQRLRLHPLFLAFQEPKTEFEYRTQRVRELYWLHMLALGSTMLAFAAAHASQECPEGLQFEGEIVFQLVASLAVRMLVHYFMSAPLGAQVLACSHVVTCGVPQLVLVLDKLNSTGVELGPPQLPSWPSHGPATTVRMALLLFYPILLHLAQTPFLLRLPLLLLQLASQVALLPVAATAAVLTLVLTTGAMVGHKLDYVARISFVRSQELQSAHENSRRADARLNHVLKNKSAEARFLVDKVCEGLENAQLQGKIGCDSNEMRAIISSLNKVQYVHEQTVEWTRTREIFIQLQDGVYRSTMPPANIKLLMLRTFAADSNTLSLQMVAPDVLRVDANILRLQLEEARSNTLKYKEPGTKVIARAQLEQEDAYSPLWLHVSVDSQNRQGLSALTKSECIVAFEPKDSNYAMVSEPLRSCETNGYGLDTVAAAAAGARGRAWLSTHTDSQSASVHTVFHVRLPAFKATEEESAAVLQSEQQFSLLPAAAPVSDASSKRVCSLLKADSATSRKWGGKLPFCLGLEDSETLQMLLVAVFRRMGADPESCAIGATVEAQDSFIDLALGTNTGKPADLVVLDHNLNINGLQRPTGVQVAEALHARGFKGVVTIHSGLSEHELREVQQLPFIALVCIKGFSAARLSHELSEVYMTHMSRTTAAETGTTATQPLGTCSEEAGSGSAESSSGVAEPHWPPEAPSAGERPVVNLTHLADFSRTQTSRVISPFYDERGKRGGLLLIDQLELAVNAGQPVSDLAHRLRGDATTGGAITLAQQVLNFSRGYSKRTTDENRKLLAQLRRTLMLTRKQLIDDQLLLDS